MAEELGWLKLTQALEPIENVCQFRIAWLELCVICMFDPEVEMLAAPAATVPPVGSVVVAVWAYAPCQHAAARASTQLALLGLLIMASPPQIGRRRWRSLMWRGPDVL